MRLAFRRRGREGGSNETHCDTRELARTRHYSAAIGIPDIEAESPPAFVDVGSQFRFGADIAEPHTEHVGIIGQQPVFVEFVDCRRTPRPSISASR